MAVSALLHAAAPVLELCMWVSDLALLVPGFMGTGACLLDKENDMPCGLIIEKVNGIPCEKRLTQDESFADVRYLLELCAQVSIYMHQILCALNRYKL